MARILFYSPSPQSKTGYGTVVRYAIPYLTERGHNVEVFAYNGHPGSAINYNGAIIWPRGGAVFDYFPELVAKRRPDVVVVVCDPWIVPAEMWRKLSGKTKLAFWFPVHAAPLHPEFAEVCRAADVLMCYSAFGTDVVQRAGIECTHVPLGFEPSVYKLQDKAAARTWFEEAAGGRIDGPLVGMVAANVHTMPRDRKGFSIAMQAWQRAHALHGGLLYVHTRGDDAIGGEDLNRLAAIVGVTDSVRFQSVFDWATQVDDQMMARLYAAFDVLLAPSRVEGFGMPHLEAQACGTPVVMTNSSSMPEIMFHGMLCEPAQMDVFDTVAGGWYPVPSVDNTARGVLHVLDGKLTTSGGGALYEDMVATYGWQTVIGRLCEVLRV